MSTYRQARGTGQWVTQLLRANEHFWPWVLNQNQLIRFFTLRIRDLFNPRQTITTVTFAPCRRLLDADISGRRDSPCSVNCRADEVDALLSWSLKAASRMLWISRTW